MVGNLSEQHFVFVSAATRYFTLSFHFQVFNRSSLNLLNPCQILCVTSVPTLIIRYQFKFVGKSTTRRHQSTISSSSNSISSEECEDSESRHESDTEKESNSDNSEMGNCSLDSSNNMLRSLSLSSVVLVDNVLEEVNKTDLESNEIDSSDEPQSEDSSQSITILSPNHSVRRLYLYPLAQGSSLVGGSLFHHTVYTRTYILVLFNILRQILSSSMFSLPYHDPLLIL